MYSAPKELGAIKRKIKRSIKEFDSNDKEEKNQAQSDKRKMMKEIMGLQNNYLKIRQRKIRRIQRETR